MFKNQNLFRANSPVAKGVYAKLYKGSVYLYINGFLVDSQFQILGSELSLTKAAKVVNGYSNVNGRSWWKQISINDLSDEARQKLTEMGLLEQ